MDLNQFLRERRSRWERLSTLLDEVDSRSLAGLTPQKADELFALYRLVSSDLNLVQTRTGNPALLEYLEQLVGRAYANLAVPRKARILRSWWEIVRNRFPATIRAERNLLLLATSFFLSGILFGFFLTLFQPVSAEVFLPAEHLAMSPRERVAMEEEMERSGLSNVPTGGMHAAFSTFLFTHNIRVMVLGFALGFTFGIGTVIILFYNGVILGSIAALYLMDGVLTFFLGWVGPHGAIELPCILFGCTGGFMLARAQFQRDEGTFRRQFRRLRPVFVDLIVGTATLLVLAGIIEGGFSQVDEPTLPYFLKISVAVTLFCLLLVYLFVLPIRGKSRHGEEEAEESFGLLVASRPS